MLTFFRNIRKQLVESSAGRKYILYAIGEIALVVVGILIALQVNNWNEGRKAHNRLKVHFAELKDETELNLRTWDAHLQRFNTVDSAGLYVRQYLNNELTMIDTTKLKTSILSAGHLAIFNLNRVAYDNLLNSGEINLITNHQLKQGLSRIYSQEGWSQSVQRELVIKILIDYEQYKHYFTEPMMNRVYFHNQMLARFSQEDFSLLSDSIEAYSIEWKSLKSDREFSVILDRVNLVRLNQRSYYQSLKNYMTGVLDILKQELGETPVK